MLKNGVLGRSGGGLRVILDISDILPTAIIAYTNFKYNIPVTSFSIFLVFKFVDIILQIAYNIP